MQRDNGMVFHRINTKLGGAIMKPKEIKGEQVIYRADMYDVVEKKKQFHFSWTLKESTALPSCHIVLNIIVTKMQRNIMIIY